MWFQQIIRSFFYAIDSTLFNFIPTLYDILIKISRSSILSQGNIREIANRVQMILGVFMLFKVAISLITYILNPDEFSDKGKGVSKLGQNVVISLVLLVITPYIFNYAFVLQSKILESNALATVIFGEQGNDNDYLLTAGDRIAFSIMLPFFSPNVSAIGKYDNGEFDLSSCNNLYETNADSSTGIYYSFNSECLTQMNVALNHKEDDDIDQVLMNYSKGIEYSSLGLTFRQDIAKKTIGGKEATDGDSFLIDYNIPITTVVAVVVLLLLISFCLDVALRSLKLALLQLIAPIPIISYIDPKSGKDGLFKKWYSMCFSTYLSLFVRLLALYFGIYIISLVGKMQMYDVVDNSLINDPIVYIFIIIGALMFAKQLPKILEGLGLKLDGGNGSFSLNPFKKIEKDALGGKQLVQGAKGIAATTAAAGLAGASNFASKLPDLADKNKWAERDKDGNIVKNADGSNKVTAKSIAKNLGKTVGGAVGSGIAGTASATFRGTGKAIKGEKMGKIFADSYGEAMFAKKKREDDIRRAGLENAPISERVKFGFESLSSDVARWTGNYTQGQRDYLRGDELDNEVTVRENKIKDLKNKQAKLRQAEFDNYEKAQNIGKNIDSLLEMDKGVKAAKSAWENAKSRGDSDERIKELYDLYKQRKGFALEREYNDSNSAIHTQVDLYNNIRSTMTTEQQSIFKELNANVNTTLNSNGGYVKDGSDVFQVLKDSRGVSYYIDQNGTRHDESSWSSAVSSSRFDYNSSGVNILGDNDDKVNERKVVFESTGDYAKYENDIKTAEAEIEGIKASQEYIDTHNENSRAKIADNRSFNRETEKPGYKPPAAPVQPRGANFGGGFPTPPGPGPGGPTPPPPPPGTP